MFSNSDPSPKRVSRALMGVLLALLGVAMFAGFGFPGADAPGTHVTAAGTIAAADSAAAGESLILDVARLGREAVRVLTTMIAAVFEGWWQSVDVALDWLDGVRRGWTAVHRFPGAGAPRS